MQQQQCQTHHKLTLKHMNLTQQYLSLKQGDTLTLQVSHSNSHHLSNYTSQNQTDEQTCPMSQGSNFSFQEPFKQGEYHLICLNYPKIKCRIQVAGNHEEEIIQETSKKKEPDKIYQLSPTPIDALAEVQQQKEEQLKEYLDDNPFGTPISSRSKEQYEQLLDQNQKYDALPNKYLKYFQDQFKQWRDFFEVQEKSSPELQRPSATNSNQGSFNSSQKSQGGKLQSQPEIPHFDLEDFNVQRIMKKTNSEYGFKMDQNESLLNEKEVIRSRISRISTPKCDDSQSTQCMVDWAVSWAKQNSMEQVIIKSKNDHYLIRQWFGYLKNKFVISEFMYK